MTSDQADAILQAVLNGASLATSQGLVELSYLRLICVLLACMVSLLVALVFIEGLS